VLANDLSNCLGKAISVVVSDVDLDLDGHTIGGFVGFPLPEGFGIAVGAGVSRGVSHVRIHGPGTIHDFMDGVLFEQVSHSELLGVTVSVNYRGLVLNQGFGAGETGRSTDNRIQDNVFSNNVTSGLIIDGGDANRFRGNVSSGNGGHGFWLFRAGGNDLRGNTATGNGQTGFRVSDASDAADGLGSFGNVIHGNTASGDLGPDLLDAWGDCAHNTWTGNTFGTASPMCIR
jgi:parallel beta-helix repeat protein